MYEINYNDDRFKKVESEKQSTLNNANNMYNQMINGTDKVYQDLVDATKDYAQTQSDLQQQRTDFAIEKIEQEKEKSERDYLKEQKGSYADYQKAIDQYGINAEANASQGLKNSGYSETSRIAAFQTYQNRYATARQSYNDALLNYNNSIKEAQLANSSALAEIAFNAMKTQLETTIQGFQYKNTLLQGQLQTQMEIDNNYYNRWSDVLQQMNTENALKEQIRQYNEQFEYQKQRDAIADSQWERQFALSASSRSGGRSSGGRSSGGKTYQVNTPYYQGKYNKDAANGTKTFSNGYQPDNVNGYKLSSTGNTVTFNTTTLNGQSAKVTQNIWTTKVDGKTKYYVWDGRDNAYHETNKKGERK